jgi:hypothetical protein
MKASGTKLLIKSVDFQLGGEVEYQDFTGRMMLSIDNHTWMKLGRPEELHICATTAPITEFLKTVDGVEVV